MEQRILSRWLKLVLVGVGLCGLVVYALILPLCGQSRVGSYPEMANRCRPWLIFLWLTGVPCYIALIIGWKIASNIGRDRSTAENDALRLKRIALPAVGDLFEYRKTGK